MESRNHIYNILIKWKQVKRLLFSWMWGDWKTVRWREWTHQGEVIFEIDTPGKSEEHHFTEMHLDMDLLNLRFALDIWKKMRRKKVININLKLKEIWAGDEEVCAISFRWGLSQNTLLIITRLVRGVQESKSGNKQKITTINECLQNRIKMKFSGESTKRKCCQWNKIYEIL